jgi:hypothetical protein
MTQSGRQKISQHETEQGPDLVILGKTGCNITHPYLESTKRPPTQMENIDEFHIDIRGLEL